MAPDSKKRFTVTQDHLALLAEMETSWDDCEFGAPEIDPKRPYGNSDVINDMRDILGEGYTDEQLHALHREMQTVLACLLRGHGLRLGEYTADEYRSNWHIVEQVA
jgi:hypothetical protein